ncbi:MAG: NUDIX domain-containing protein [Oscillospiraceae bacterium]|nr:NUDIX domain-containing protein [Oscillospiraceae bacterium]
MPPSFPDITYPSADGVFNLRVGAIILQNENILMVTNTRDPYYYSVGGRVKLHETLEDAVVRETFEETGVPFEIDRLVWIHENFFTITGGANDGRRYHELSFFYLMKSNPTAAIQSGSYSNDGTNERLEWLSLDRLNEYELYPEMFRTELRNLPNVPTTVITIE